MLNIPLFVFLKTDNHKFLQKFTYAIPGESEKDTCDTFSAVESVITIISREKGQKTLQLTLQTFDYFPNTVYRKAVFQKLLEASL